jgi:hypothetical protein
MEQLSLFSEKNIKTVRLRTNGSANKLDVNDKQFHDWYRFVLSFPPHLVREYITKFGLKEDDARLVPPEQMTDEDLAQLS